MDMIVLDKDARLWPEIIPCLASELPEALPPRRDEVGRVAGKVLRSRFPADEPVALGRALAASPAPRAKAGRLTETRPARTPDLLRAPIAPSLD